MEIFSPLTEENKDVELVELLVEAANRRKVYRDSADRAKPGNLHILIF